MRHLFVAAIALFALGACAQTPAPVAATPAPSVTTATSAVPAPAPTDPLSGLRAFTIADLQAASADAKAQTPPDTTSAMCWDFLAANLPTLPTFQPGAPVGAVLAFQKLRDLANGTVSQNGFLKQMNIACAPVVIDTQTTVNKLILLGAGGAVTGGTLAPALGGLGALLP